MTTSKILDTSVLVVGAGPVGLALALELGRRNISCILVEKRDGRTDVPKMSEVSTRIMEFCRRWGIADEARTAVWPNDPPSDFLYVDTLQGQLRRRQLYNPPSREKHGYYTPEPAVQCPQIFFDPILARHAAQQESVTILYKTELVGFVEHADIIVSELKDPDGQPVSVRSRYLVGCDGASSIVREALDIPLSGLGDVAQSVSLFFDSPELVSLHDKGFARNTRLIDAGGCWGELIPIDSRGLWRLTIFDEPESAQDPDRYMRRMLGQTFPYKMLNVMQWSRKDFVADSYGRGRVFIAGDAAHQVSPTGGIGMATGVEEAVNLGWKIAAVIEGWGGPRLLESYGIERRPVAQRNAMTSTRTYQALMAIPKRAEGEPRTTHDERVNGVLMDLDQYATPDFVKVQYTYEDSPICVADGTPADPVLPRTFTPSARPGARAPHAWLTGDQSVFDVFGEDFTLLRLGKSAPDGPDFQVAAQMRNVRLSVVHIVNPDVEKLYETALVLIRPDGHVAWRGSHAGEDALAIIDQIRGA
ncbi:FAD-dependent monooxygenase [Paraburkholderia phymatum]|uniref:FAD-dependent monooxygenase n=1 Tax=Paraburkholderia phymatum TaxID=148447 RepID=UPI003177B3BB